VIVIADQRPLGANTLVNPKQLGPGLGVNASNLDSSQGDFRGRRDVTTAHTLVGYGATQQHSLYRMGRETVIDTQYWLAFTVDVDFARSLLANDTTERTYGTAGSFTKPAYTDNTFLGSTPYPTSYYYMGIPAPATGMTATVNTAGTGNNETRTYVSTYVRYNDDEGPPSQAVTLICAAGSSVNLSAFPSDPSATYGVTKRRIYVATTGDFRLCVDSTVLATATLVDSGTRGEILQTGGSTAKPDWEPPDDNMIGLIELWNGMHGGFYKNQYGTCVPYKPHAWPVVYRRQIPDRIIGTAKFSDSWVLATSGIPRVVRGASPEGMLDKPINLKEGCVAKRSVVGVEHGVCWASNRGLCYYGTKGAMVLTRNIFTEAQWQALVPSTILGAYWQGYYIGFYNDGTRRGFMLPVDDPSGVIFLTQGAYATFSDPLSGTLYILDSSNVIKKWDAGTVMSATFKSRVFRHPRAVTPSAARIIGTTYPVTFSLWADGTLKVNAQSIANDTPFRLPGGYAAEEFQYQIVGTGPIEMVAVAEEMVDLV
jgi:hypothetical protein